MVYLLSFFIKHYWRTTYCIIQFLVYAIVFGIFLDPRYAPYSYEYIVLVKSVFLIIISVITVFQLSVVNYNRSNYVILSRIKREWYYLGSAISSFLIVLGFSLLADLFIISFAGIFFSELFTISLILYSIVNILLTITTASLFSVYIVKNKYLIVGLLIIGFGLIPKWYVNLPLENVLYYINFLLPPLSINIVLQQNRVVFNWSLITSLIYMGLTLEMGVWLFKNKNLYW